MSIKSISRHLIFESDVVPTKFMLGLASTSWALLEFIINHSYSLFMFMTLLYGIGLFWRIMDEERRVVQSCILSVTGAVFWTYEAWFEILSPAESISETSHIVTSASFALASLWLLMRSGTKHTINKECSYKKNCPFQER